MKQRRFIPFANPLTYRNCPNICESLYFQLDASSICTIYREFLFLKNIIFNKKYSIAFFLFLIFPFVCKAATHEASFLLTEGIITKEYVYDEGYIDIVGYDLTEFTESFSQDLDTIKEIPNTITHRSSSFTLIKFLQVPRNLKNQKYL